MQNTYTACVFYINFSFVNLCNKTIINYPKTLFSVYDLLYLKNFQPEKYEKITGGYKSLYLYVVNHFENSIIDLAKGMPDSQITLNKDIIKGHWGFSAFLFCFLSVTN